MRPVETSLVRRCTWHIETSPPRCCTKGQQEKTSSSCHPTKAAALRAAAPRPIIDNRVSGYSAFPMLPGTRFQTFVLENYYCPVVRPFSGSSSSHVIWVSQTNGTSPSSSGFVASGLDYHFCSRPEAFHVRTDAPFIYSSTVASHVVKLLLLRIGVFAMDGIIFLIHGDRQAAVLAVSSTDTSKTAGQVSNFEFGDVTTDHLESRIRPSNLPEQCTGMQLDATISESACHLYREPGDLNKKSLVSNALSTHPLNAPPSSSSPFTATSQLLHPTSSHSLLTTAGDNDAYSSHITNAGAQDGCHRNHQAQGNRTRTQFTGDGSDAMPASKQLTRPPRPVNFLKTTRNSLLRKCFRCLATDHLVSACRDPIKCARCLRSGHRSFQCKTFIPNKM